MRLLRWWCSNIMHSDMTYVCVRRTWKTDKILCTHKLLPSSTETGEYFEHVRDSCVVIVHWQNMHIFYIPTIHEEHKHSSYSFSYKDVTSVED